MPHTFEPKGFVGEGYDKVGYGVTTFNGNGVSRKVVGLSQKKKIRSKEHPDVFRVASNFVNINESLLPEHILRSVEIAQDLGVDLSAVKKLVSGK